MLLLFLIVWSRPFQDYDNSLAGKYDKQSMNYAKYVAFVLL